MTLRKVGLAALLLIAGVSMAQTPAPTNAVSAKMWCYVPTAGGLEDWKPCGTGGGGGGGIPIIPFVYTPAAPSGALVLASGGVAQALFAPAEVTHGCLISNPLSATDQGIATAENIYISFITTAVAGGGVATVPLYPGQSLPCPGGLTTGVSWIAATVSHKINAFKD